MEKALLVCDFCNGNHRLAVNRYPLEGVIPGRKSEIKYVDVCAAHDKLMQSGMSALYKSIAGKARPRGRGKLPRGGPPREVARPGGKTWTGITSTLAKSGKPMTAGEIAARIKVKAAFVQEALYRATRLEMVTRSGKRPFHYQLAGQEKGREKMVVQ